MAKDTIIKARVLKWGNSYGLRIQKAFEEHRIPVAASEVAMLPQSHVKLEDKKAAQMLRLMEVMEDHEDVQHVWANFDIDESDIPT